MGRGFLRLPLPAPTMAYAVSQATFSVSLPQDTLLSHRYFFIFILEFHISYHFPLPISSGSVVNIMLNTVLSSVTANILYICLCAWKSGCTVQTCVDR